MKVRAIAVTRPLIDECESPGDLIAYCARVSNPANQANTETSPRLLRYLTKNKHWSPFEMAHLVIEITTTRDIARQILRHRSFAFQEFSQRYAAVGSSAFVTREARLQDSKNRQSSIEDCDESIRLWWEREQRILATHADAVYQQALNHGIAKEVARSVLPEGMTESKLYMAGSVRSWIHFLQVRTDMSTQKEHRLVADACRQVLLEHFPDLIDAVNSSG